MADFKKLKDGQGNFYNVKDETARTNLASHTGNTSNPHSVTKAQVGLGNVDNTSDANKPISNAQAAVNETKFDKANVKATPASTPSNDNVVSEKYSEETYAKKDGYYETFGYAREAGIAKNLQNDEGKLLDPDTATSSGTVYADQPFTQRATAMTMNAYLNNELISVGSGYEQWKKEQAFSVVKNQVIKNGNFADASEDWYNSGVSKTIANNTLTFTINQDVGGVSIYVVNDYTPTPSHKFLMTYKAKVSRVGIDLGYGIGGTYRTSQFVPTDTNWHAYCQIDTFTSNDVYKYIYIGNCLTGDEVQFRDYQIIDLTQWFASRPEIATALNGDAGVKWFLQNYPECTGYVDYDEGTIVDTEDYEYQTTGVNLWDEEWELGIYSTANGNPITSTEQIRNKNYIKIFPNTDYYFAGPTSPKYIAVLYYDANKNYISTTQGFYFGSVKKTPENAKYMKFFLSADYGTTYNHDIQICNHFTETTVENTYHPYEIYKNRVSWAFTSTGKGKSAGKAADTKDYVNKKNIEKVGRVDLGTLDWTYNSNYKVFLSSNIPDLWYNGSGSTQNMICSKYTVSNDSSSDSPDKTIYPRIVGSEKNVGVKDSAYTDVATFKAAMSGVYLNYELATPTETDMTGDELDTNIPENDYGVERKVPVSGNMFSGSSTTIFYQDNVLRQIYNNKTSIDNLQEAVNNIEARIPTVPTADGTYTLKAVVSNGVVTYSWTLDSQGV